jgi:hypothetical protein
MHSLISLCNRVIVIDSALEGENSDRRGSVDADKPVERPRLKLLPRSAPPAAAEAESETASATEPFQGQAR